MVPIWKVSTKTFATLGDRKAGSVGPKWISSHQAQQGQQYNNGFLLVPGNVVHDGQFVDIIQLENFLQFQGNDGQ